MAHTALLFLAPLVLMLVQIAASREDVIMKPQKKREHVKGAWWYIAGCIAFFAWCAETGRDPGAILDGVVGAGFFLCGALVVFCFVVAIIGGILGGNGK
ncbi:MAG: hypothetical protein IK051_04360 [Rhodocyclaceae bacterium]|nr:hypothetical protein [Rhodocyclaceae bacterium]MBR4736878.1 hypothetical protein [Rhodocyclaceae bacterium]